MLKVRLVRGFFALILVLCGSALFHPSVALADGSEATGRDTTPACAVPNTASTASTIDHSIPFAQTTPQNGSATESNTLSPWSTSSLTPVDGVRVTITLTETQAVTMLNAAEETGDSPLIAPQVTFGEDSLIQIRGQVAVRLLFGLTRYGSLLISGGLVTQSGTLEFEPQQITFDGLDVTSQYYEQVKTLFGSALTKMMPEHLYVKSAQVEAGCVIVQGIETTPTSSDTAPVFALP